MLKSLELVGFKSFADRTRFEFSEGITAVVGPNGSGKSNVVDGIKWILGDQSAKSLRGKEMTDVIFNGALNRKASSLAEATITFDNTNGFLPVEAQEVQVGRRLWSSGDSEYLINRETVRLKDVRRLFMGTGAGSAAYSIIEQGRVDQILQANPTARRAIFEEAAGISLFKSRRAEFLRRMERVDQLLVRLTDIVDELEVQRNSLRNQAEKAAAFRELSEELRTLWQGLAADDYRFLTAQATEIQTQLTSHAAELTERETQRDKLECGVLKLDVEIGAVDEQIQTVQRQSSSIRETIAGHLATIELQTHRDEEFRADLSRLMKQHAVMTARSRESRAELDHNHGVLATCEAETRRLQQELATRASQVEETSAEVTAAREELEASVGLVNTCKETLEKHRQRVLSLLTQRQAATTARETASSRLHELEQQLDSLKQQAVDSAERLSDAESALATAETTLKTVSEQREKLLTEQNQFRVLLSDLREERSAGRARQSLLEDYEARQEGLGIGVREILRRATKSSYSPWNQIVGSVADLIDVELEDAALLEAALGNRAQLIVIRDFAALVEYLNKNAAPISGRVGFVEIRPAGTGNNAAQPADIAHVRLHQSRDGISDESLATQTGVIRRADDLVQPSAGFPNLAAQVLADTWVVESLEVAFELASTTGNPTRFVTLKGELLESDGTLIVGTPRSETAIVSRKSELRKLKTDLARLERRIGDEERRLSEMSEELSAMDTEVIAARRQHDAVKEGCDDCKSQHAELNRELKRQDREHSTLGDEIESHTTVEKEFARESASCEMETARDEEELRELGTRIETTERKIAKSEHRQQLAREQRSTEELSLAKQNERLRGLNDSVERLERDQTQRQQQRKEAEKRLASIREKQRAVELGVLNTRSTLAEQYLADERVLHAGNGLLVEQNRLRGLRGEIRREETALRDADRLSKERQHESEIGLRDIQNRIENLAERLQEEYHLDLDEIAESGASAFREYLADLNGSDEPDDESDSDDAIAFEDVRDELEKRVNRLRRKRKMMGNVDIESLANLDELETRYTRLSTTLSDLLAAKRHLEDLVRKIDVRCKEMFATTFEAVRANFQELFRKAFGGGDGDIVLEDADDVLECGIDIVARPPGKELKSITLMSGGEKTLTAFALLLSIFKFRPSPYCVLDEVDAALDEANVERMLALLEEFKQSTQFVIITHKKPTMTIADQIYGVTMEQSGVSKRMSVRFENVRENGEFETGEDDVPAAA